MICISKMYYESFIKYWVPILKKDVFKYRMKKDNLGLLSIKENIWKNWHFTKEQRDNILKLVGLTNI